MGTKSKTKNFTSGGRRETYRRLRCLKRISDSNPNAVSSARRTRLSHFMLEKPNGLNRNSVQGRRSRNFRRLGKCVSFSDGNPKRAAFSVRRQNGFQTQTPTRGVRPGKRCRTKMSAEFLQGKLIFRSARRCPAVPSPQGIRGRRRRRWRYASSCRRSRA